MASTGRFGLEIHAANAGDAPGLADLLATAGPPIAAGVLAERLEALLRHPGAVLLAGEWGPPTGLVVVHWRRSLFSDMATARIDLLLVDPGQRRRGVGRLLLKAASQAARAAGCGTIELAALPDEPTLAGFCEATGFTMGGVDYARPLRKGASRDG